MYKVCLILFAATLLVTSIPAFADLEQVQVGGELHIRGNWIRHMIAPVPEVRYTPAQVHGRAIGGPFWNLGVVSPLDWNKDGPDMKFVEQRTRLNVKANFSDKVTAFIELDSVDVWGEDFRSDYLTGIDSRETSGVVQTPLDPDSDVQLFQAYVEANEMFGYPVRARIGRQELVFGSEFLVGNGDSGPIFKGLSFDGIRLTYSGETFSVDGWWAKLAERSPLEEDGDTNFYGVYASCKAIENVTFDAYWLYLRDSSTVVDTPGGWRWKPDYSGTELHTLGLRAAGKYQALDFEAEVAYQFGGVDHLGSTFNRGWYGDDSADASVWGGNLEVGYSFDVKCHPRLFVGATYFGGEDNRDVSFADWLRPFARPSSSVSFNRLFSDQVYSGFFDLNSDYSNAYLVRIGAMGMVTEKLMARLCITYFDTVAEFDSPAFLGAPSFLTKQNDGYLGTEAFLLLVYQYSKDLSFEAGWAHLFTGKGLEEGSFNAANGTIFTGGSDKDQADYIFLGTRLSF